MINYLEISLCTICDRCGDEVPVIDMATGLDAWPDWAGAMLCPDCWKAAHEEAEAQRVPWQPAGANFKE